jgi:hypothetical protein
MRLEGTLPRAENMGLMGWTDRVQERDGAPRFRALAGMVRRSQLAGPRLLEGAAGVFGQERLWCKPEC